MNESGMKEMSRVQSGAKKIAAALGFLFANTPGRKAARIAPLLAALAALVPFALNSLAALYGARGDYDAELAWSQRAMAVAPWSARACFNYGNALAALGRVAEAEKAYQSAAEREPHAPLGPYGLGLLAEQRRDLTSAITLYRKALAADPAFGPGYMSLAEALIQTGQNDAALDTLNTLAARRPDLTDTNARILYAMVLREKSAARFRWLYAADPERDFRAALQKKDYRLIELNDTWPYVPGVDQGCELKLMREDVNHIHGFTDVDTGGELTRLRGLADTYAAEYNKRMLTSRREKTGAACGR